jgi:predicted nuclease of predicted toxin-antitoxin system
MRLLVDANLSPVVRTELHAAGYDASHVYDHDLGTASDDEIASFAGQTQADLPTIEPELEAGAIVSISPTHLRVRRLPLRS